MARSMQSLVKDINVLLNENRKLHATVGSLKCQLEVVERDNEAMHTEEEAKKREIDVLALDKKEALE